MNATLSDSSGRGERPERVTPMDAAAELRTAGEALCRAAHVIASMSERSPRRQQGSPRSQELSSAERLSGKQLGAIRGAARRAGLSRDRLGTLIEGLTGKVEPAELNRQEASAVIDRLFSMSHDAR